MPLLEANIVQYDPRHKTSNRTLMQDEMFLPSSKRNGYTNAIENIEEVMSSRTSEERMPVIGYCLAE